MNALDRLLLEELPTGRFGGPHSRPARTRGALPPTSAVDQARHRAELAAAIHIPQPPHRHLQPVPDQPDTQEHAA